LIPVVVLQYGRFDLTAPCLASLRQQTHPVEITLVDNDSPGRSDSILRELASLADRHHFLEENLGYAGGNNVALREILTASSEYVIVVNNDTELSPTCVASLVRFADDRPHAGQVCPRVEYPDGRLQAAGGRIRAHDFEPQMIGHQEPGTFDEPAQVRYAPGMALLVRTAAIRDAGLIPEEFFLYSEDVAWSLAMSRHGWEIWYTPSARVTHFESAATGNVHPRKAYYLIRSAILLAQRHLAADAFRDFARTYRYKLLRHSVKNAMRPRYVAACWRGARDGFRGRTGPVH
jgi:GT2 family glycosyltransferase